MDMLKDKKDLNEMWDCGKACSEILTSSFRRSFLSGETSFALASARAGNVIGGGDWAADRIVPDCVRSLLARIPIRLRNPDAVRPWKHVLEPLAGYLILGAKLLQDPKKFSQAYNFGPENNAFLRVEELVEKILEQWGGGEMIINRYDNLHEAKLLLLDITKAKTELGFRPVIDASFAVEMSVKWYKYFYGKEGNMKNFSVGQIENFTEFTRGKKIVWSN